DGEDTDGVVDHDTETEASTEDVAEVAQTKFGTGLMLAIAYAASIGSLGTIIGTPPNALLAAHIAAQHDMCLGVGRWMLVGITISIGLMVAAWFILTKLKINPSMKRLPGGFYLI